MKEEEHFSWTNMIPEVIVHLVVLFTNRRSNSILAAVEDWQLITSWERMGS